MKPTSDQTVMEEPPFDTDEVRENMTAGHPLFWNPPTSTRELGGSGARALLSPPAHASARSDPWS